MSNEWYTPAKYIEAARLVMGGIDLDPASCEMANRTVKATTYYTAEQNGLLQPWYGRVWLNPPYSLANNRGPGGLFKSSIENFSNRLIAKYESGHVEQAVMLVIAKVDTQWFQHVWNYPLCFPGYAVKFYGTKNKPKNTLKQLFGTVFVYLGPNEALFVSTFSKFGRIVKAIDKPPERPHNLELWRDGCET